MQAPWDGTLTLEASSLHWHPLTLPVAHLLVHIVVLLVITITGVCESFVINATLVISLACWRTWEGPISVIDLRPLQLVHQDLHGSIQSVLRSCTLTSTDTSH